MVNHAVIAGLGFAGFGQAVHQVHMAGEAARAPDAAHRGQAAEVDANADGDAPRLRRLHHLPHLLLVPQIARIQPQAVHPAGGALQRQLIVKMDVGHQRNADLPLDFRHSFGGFQIRHGGADDFAAGFLQLVDLPHGGFHIAGVRFGH